MRVLTTERLALRWFGEADAAFVLELVNDPAWLANIGDRGCRTLDEARAWIASRLVTSYWDRGLGLWAVERRDDGALLGMCGLLERDGLPAIDVGYALVPRARGAGYAREAVAACLRYAHEALGADRVLAIVRPQNAPSIRVLQAVGMERIGSHRFEAEAHDLALFATPAPAAVSPDDGTAVDVLVRRFYAAFGNRDALSRVASVPSFFIPDARVTIVRPDAPGGVEALSVRGFLAPRAELLQGGRLLGFEEHEVSGATELTGRLAFHAGRYEKNGTLDGTLFRGGGDKHFQLVKTARTWKISALAWADHTGATR